jgi:DNA-directed RNA polymerase specialized sigma24 family protein
MFGFTGNRCCGLLSLCINDVAKQMLLSNTGFIPLLIDGLLLDPDHPRKDTDDAIKTAVQRDFAECIQQISLYPAGCMALKADSAIIPALDVLVDKAWSEEAKDCARGALMQLTDRQRETVAAIDLDALHIMMSCECPHFSFVL